MSLNFRMDYSVVASSAPLWSNTATPYGEKTDTINVFFAVQ